MQERLWSRRGTQEGKKNVDFLGAPWDSQTPARLGDGIWSSSKEDWKGMNVPSTHRTKPRESRK